jgi:hypothetical protein
MNYEKATKVVATIQKAVISTQSGLIEQVFSALVFLDGHQIMQRAQLFLAETSHEHLKMMTMADDDPLHRLTMDVFYSSLLEPMQDKPAEVEASVEHDIPTWIEANAAAIASANIRIMEDALPTEEISLHRTLIEFHRHIDFAACEDEQNAALQHTWSAIEKKIEAFVADNRDE